jgi:hypothetical protein
MFTAYLVDILHRSPSVFKSLFAAIQPRLRLGDFR